MNIEDIKKAKKDYDNSKLKVAKMAYKAMKYAIDEIENIDPHLLISCCWDGCIRVDDEVFTENQLIENSNNS